MISIQQCRAARGLLGWTQQDLSEASGLSKTAINNFEKGHSDIKAESLKAIRMAFESADIEFLGNEGLRKRVDNTRILRGDKSFIDLLNDIYETLKTTGGEILISNIDERTSDQVTRKTLLEHGERLQKAGITQRILTGHSFDAGPAVFRSIPHETAMAAMVTFIYGNKVAFELWEQSMILIINSPEASNAERQRFKTLWSLAQSDNPRNSNATSLGRAHGT